MLITTSKIIVFQEFPIYLKYFDMRISFFNHLEKLNLYKITNFFYNLNELTAD